MSKKKIAIVSDGSDWALDQTAQEISWTAQYLGYDARVMKYPIRSIGASRTHFLSPDIAIRFGRVSRDFSLDYFHGLPHQGLNFDLRFRRLLAMRNRISKIRVTHAETFRALEDNGFGGKLAQIPLSVDLNKFHVARDKAHVKSALGISPDAFVIGSFQKDGLGWGAGMSPKLEKGPDILAKTVGLMSRSIGNLHVLLAGPSRGFLTSRLTEMGIPFSYMGLVTESEITTLYQALDVYVVASRFEGGPRAILESLASGVPVVTTPVGQSQEILQGELRDFIAQSFEPMELADLALMKTKANINEPSWEDLCRATAESFSLGKQANLWKQFFE